MGFSSPPNPKQFQTTVWEIVRQVPPGQVTTYGQIAAMIPAPGSLNLKDYEAFGARWVGGAMANCPGDVPWQRVINSQGRISPRPGAERQKELLESEGVEFDDKERVNFDLYGWNGPDPEWCQARSLFIPKPLGKPQLKLF
jgi:methylated-DNA-protein-cysteine methyltransferase-like protein